MSEMLGRYTAQLETRQHCGLASRSAARFLATLQFEMSRLRGRSNGDTRDRCFDTQPHKLGLIAMSCTSLGSSALHFLKWLLSCVWGGGKCNAQMSRQSGSSSELALHCHLEGWRKESQRGFLIFFLGVGASKTFSDASNIGVLPG